MGKDIDPTPYHRYISAMNEGDPGTIASLFAANGVYVEPFSTGRPNEVVGPDAIRQYFELSMQMRPADMTVALDRVEVRGGVVTSRWTCSSKDWDQPIKGFDEMEVSEGKIVRLKVNLDFGQAG